MVLLGRFVLLVTLGQVAASSCPFGHSSAHEEVLNLEKRAAPGPGPNILAQFTVNDTNVYLTSDAGGPISDQNSLTAGERGPTLLEDFIFRQKITHFDHERVRLLPRMNQLISLGAGTGGACAGCR
jgi:catalase